MFDLQFIKSIIEVYHYYQSKNYNNSEFLLMIDKCFIVIKQDFRKKILKFSGNLVL